MQPTLRHYLTRLVISCAAVCALSHTVVSYAQAATFAPNTLPASLQTAISTANLNPDNVSIVVTRLPDSPAPMTAPPKPATVIAYHADTPRTPASTQKLIPTLIALDTLGKDFMWKTKLYQHGIVWRGTLYGDIIIQASGDPKLSTEQLSNLLAQVKAHGIERITGSVIIDSRCFGNVGFDPNAFDGKGLRPYNAMPNALLLNFGTLTVTLEPFGKTTADTTTIASTPNPATIEPTTQANITTDTLKAADITGFRVKVSPQMTGFSAPQTLAAAHAPCKLSKDDWIADLTPTALSFHQDPSVNCGTQQRWLTYPDPNRLAKQTIHYTWRQQFPAFGGQLGFVDDITPDPTWRQRWIMRHTRPKLLAYASSAPLADVIADINHYSNNVMTEQVALSLPLYADHQAVSDYPKTFDFIARWWKQHLPDTPPPVMSRASGLCRDCRVTPNSLVSLLGYAYTHKDFKVYRQSLSVAGETGTMRELKARDPNHPAIGQAWIKTGTLDDTIGMAGYVRGQSGQWYAVVGLINQPNVRFNGKAKGVLDTMLRWTAEQ